MKKIGIISDSHGTIKPFVVKAFKGVDQIIHLGDICSLDNFTFLNTLAPVQAVKGNCDRGVLEEMLPSTMLLEIENCSFYLLHILDYLDIEPKSIGVDAVLYGHSHRPYSKKHKGVLYVNPGSVAHQRSEEPCSVAIMTVDKKKIDIKFIWEEKIK